MSNIYQIEALKSLEQLTAIRTDWDRLVKQVGTDSPCLTYEWLTTWWHCMKDDDKELIVLVIKKEGNIIGIAPFMLVKDRFLFLNIREIRFLSMSRYADSPSSITAAFDFITPNSNDDLFKAIIQFLKDNFHWHFIHLNPISGDSPNIEHVKIASRALGFINDAKVVFDNVILRISDSWPDYFKSLSRNFRKQLNAAQKKLNAVGKIDIQLYTTKSDLQYHMATLLDIEKRSWKWDVGISINSTAFRDFFYRLPGNCVGDVTIQLWLLSVAGKYIAYDYNILFNNSVVSLKGSYDSKYHLYSPGNILLAKEIEYAFEQKYNSINMLWGMTTAKQHWLPITKPYIEIVIFNKDWFSRFLFLVLVKMHFFTVRRIFQEYRDRLLRKFKIFLKNSELTRMDQLNRKGQ
ncbi:MAG: GNAT family N-acetyltransferase [Ignavibacteriales bacterium]|nr:GNAT family N-acetyltransferase [Ignavibacteriales bacterium]